MAVYGYARVSTTDQDLSIQIEALKKAGCTTIRSEKVSGTSRQGRVELDILMSFLRAGDTLVVTRIDRLARSLLDLKQICKELDDNGVAFRSTEQPIDTTSAAGVAFMDMLGVFAAFETNLRKERQAEGIARAKANNVYKGRKPSIDPEQVKALKADGMGASDIAKQLGIGRASVYRLLSA